MKFDKKAIRNTETCKKQANFNQNKPQNNPQVFKIKPQKTSPNSREKRKVANTELHPPQSSWQKTRPTTTMNTPNSVSLPKTFLALHNHTYKYISKHIPLKEGRMQGIKIYCHFVLNPNIIIKMATLAHNTQQNGLM